MLYLCRVKPLRHYLRGFLIAAWAGDKIAEFSFPEILFHFPLRPWFFFVSPRVCGEKPLRKRVCSSALGSPPRMRGKAPRVLADRASDGITPAYAGKRRGRGRERERRQDHPRVCGEKKESAAVRRLEQGSPPHMRGKVGYIHPFCHGVGITPAYAGKRSAGREFGTAAWDHPRACGEKAMSVTTMNKSQGSPPRMRGKEWIVWNTEPAERITPAYAGKSFGSVLPSKTQ